MKPILLTCLAFLLLTGCARYEFDLTHPPELAQRIGRERIHLDREPLEYAFQTADNRLVMAIRNPTEETVLLLGAESVVVAPSQRSHPLRTQPIAPGSYIRLIFPPMRPPAVRTGPRVGVGVGVGLGTGRARPGAGVGVATARHAAYDPGDTVYWDWPGETPARVILRFQIGEQIISHEFHFHRRRV